MNSAATTIQEETRSWQRVRTGGAILELLKWHFNMFVFYFLGDFPSPAVFYHVTFWDCDL